MSTVDPVLLLLTTCPDRASAERIAHALVAEHLAACVTRLDGAQSTYRWQGEVTTDTELQLLVKTTASRVDEAIARIVELHPYELPECIAVETRAGLPAYLDWIRAQTREDTD
ncbi:divalent-cation tolerance protein CutA [Stenotrophomonas indicatrix]|jgi:periplasmic divalent cation tolerance protein|uniref:divalent-cation tolerance protein CutA n=1 Tax=Stenotrophomonas TaxID=40323 RepID=UPI0003EA739B|nr:MULTISPECIES: divalent-cation tolerance protein CutA [Stenotrophomonas]EVT69088.1 dihydroorotate dehydrogenase [Stenotrophomonas maltophilia 5BA-I-2]OUL16217.1 divalent-cation tolerance protein CutA [bacterium AM6]QGL65153.1 divalent-cation tolerance protein CutA [Stenotrophomonas maltophilia]AVJ34736.1 divalent-cation tolerance protein CutA [Stenotrophomonas sp. MYb57]EZP45252.1 Dihydroorotate dehydrogenase [Stenotrophomonas sp. RIT309]